jgi:3-oxoacyl-[acyl-carrier-protein] synthase II
MRRVVVTGMGALSPLGLTFGESWEALKAGTSGIAPVTRFDVSGLPSKVAGELKGFSAGRFLSRKDLRRLDPFVHYGYAAARMAVEDAGLGPEALKSAGVIVGSSRGGVGMMEDAIRTRPTAYVMSGSTVSMAASYIARRLGIMGGTLGISNACSSGANALGEAMRMVRHGLCDVVIAGGAEAPVTRFCMGGYGASGALSRAGVSRPFDRKRDGFVLSEGAAVLVLEERGAALGRGARVYAEVAGYGTSADAFHETVPDLHGQVKAIRAALDDAGLAPGEVDFISAHATATQVGDSTEAGAVGEVFGGSGGPFVSAVKSMTGHMLGASGAMEAAFAVMGIVEGVVPPAVNLEDPEFGLNCSPEQRTAEIGVAMSNSFGFGGANAILVLRAC